MINELRIGNVIMHTENQDLKPSLRNKPVVVDVDVLYRLENDKRPMYQPIPLNPKILEAYGFVYSNDIETDGNLCDGWKQYVLCGSYLYVSPLASSGGSFRASVNNVTLTQELKHVHQLQNLWFALRGEDLKIFQFNNHV